MACVKNTPVLSTGEAPHEGFRLTIYIAGDVPTHIDGFNSIAEALEQGMEWKHRLWCSVWLGGVEVASEYPRVRLDPSDPECTAYKHVYRRWCHDQVVDQVVFAEIQQRKLPRIRDRANCRDGADL